MKLTDKQRVVLQEVSKNPADLTLIHKRIGWTYEGMGYDLKASSDTIRKQLDRLVARRLVLKRKDGYVISAAGKRALA